MVFWHKQAVKVLLEGHNWADGVIDRKDGVATTIDIMLVEEVLNALTYETKWMLRSPV